MSTMNIDRPLDEIVKESQAARKAERREKRKQTVEPRKPKAASNTPNKSSTTPNQPKLGVGKKEGLAGGPISKKQRRRERKAAAVAAANAVADEENQRPNGNLSSARHPANGRSNPPAPRNDKPPRSHHQTALGSRLATQPVPKGPSQAGRRGAPKGVKIRISNLHPGVTETDIAELFETVGPIKKAHLKTFANGHSACEAEVIFERMADALEAINRYNQVPLDNHPLHITLATDSILNDHENVHNRVGKGRGRPQHNPRKNDYPDNPDSPDRGNGYAPGRGSSPEDDRDRQGGGRLRQNRRRYRRYQNKGGNGNGSGNASDRGDRGDRDSYD